MKKNLLLLPLLLCHLNIKSMKMEIDEQQLKSLTLDENTSRHIDITTLWARLNCYLNRDHANREKQDAAKIANLSFQLSVLTSCDSPFLSEHQKKEWKTIKKNAENHALLNMAGMFNEQENKKHIKLLDELEDYTYPPIRYHRMLDIMKWMKKQIIHNPWSLNWIEQLELINDSSETMQSYSDEDIENKRLQALKQKKNKISAKLYNALNQAPEKLSQYPTTIITELLALVDPETNPQYCKDEDHKTIIAYVTVLLTIDFEWLSRDRINELKVIMNDLSKITWKKDKHSKMYYRYQLSAIKWAEQKIKEDACQNLSWFKSVFTPEGLNYQEIPCPSSDDLKQKRLAALERLKKETEELFNNLEKRIELEARDARSNRMDDDKCSIM